MPKLLLKLLRKNFISAPCNFTEFFNLDLSSQNAKPPNLSLDCGDSTEDRKSL